MSNGSRAFLAADGRTSEARLLRDREREFAEPLGGLESLTLSQRSTVESAALLSVRLEAARSGQARGETAGISDEDLIRLTNGLSRALAALERLAAPKAKPAGQSALQAFLAARGEPAA